MTSDRLQQLREQAFKRQGGTCYWCDSPMLDPLSDHPRACTAEHLQPRSRGGRDQPHNIVAACFCCNNERGNGTRKRAITRRHSRKKQCLS
jgi:hypothetical protein